MYTQRRRLFIALSAALLFSSSTVAHAEYPTRPIEFIVPTSPGSGPDVLARDISQLMGEQLGQPFVIQNRVGAAGNIGFNAIAKANSDGYTIGIVPNQFSINPSIYKLPFDTSADFEPICLVARGAMVLVTRPSLGVTDLASFIAKAKENPKSITYGSAGVGSPHHMAGALLESMAGIELLHVPYSGVSGAVTATLAGEVDAMFMAAQTVPPFIKDGRLNGLAVSTKRPSSVVPDIPTADASGLPGFDAGFWFGLLAPAGTPDAIVSRLRTEARKALEDPKLASGWVNRGLEPEYLAKDEFVALIQSDTQRWSKLIRDLGIKVE